MKLSKERLEGFFQDKYVLFKEVFTTNDEMMQYATRFNEIEDFLTFHYVLEFYHIFKKTDDVIQKRNGTSRVLHDFNKLIMITSMIELLNSKENS